MTTFSEDYEGFISRCGRMTSRLEDFILMLALETNCEGAAAICREMRIQVSGDTIIRMLRKLNDLTLPVCNDTIGVDDFAYRKGQTYCTVICDGATHAPIEILDGRDGVKLKEWLRKNKQIKKVTRDRAGAYAKAISDELPQAMQIADRFHLHQNLMKAVKEALKHELPNNISIPDDHKNERQEVDMDKKTEHSQLSEAEQRRSEDIIKIQSLLAEGYAPVQIKEMLHTTYYPSGATRQETQPCCAVLEGISKRRRAGIGKQSLNC